jgi:hypothetical protein
VLEHAPVDECYTPGSETVTYPDSNGNCDSGQTKISGAYLWGQTKLGDNIWFGTAANYLCMVLSEEFKALQMAPEPIKTDELVCEYDTGAYYQQNLAANPRFSAYEGDWRPPRIYRYNTVTQDLDEMTPADSTLVNLTEGFRAAGSVGNTVFLAGPVVGQPTSEDPAHGITIFAFDNTTGELIDSVNITDFSNIRSFLTVGDTLYAGLMTPTGGVIGRWVGTPEAPFTGGDSNGFLYVGKIPQGEGGPAELAYHQGHLVATTWNMSFASGQESQGSGVFMSPSSRAPDDPFTEADNVDWTQIWSPASYEPDPVIMGTYMGGALASYGDYLYFGTLHGVAAGALVNIMTREGMGQDPSTADIVTALVEGNRATTIWRASNLDATKPTVELLYGESTLPKYNFAQNAWVDTSTGWKPRWGPSGFGNPFNAYPWSMKVFQNQLYVGTFDWSYLLAKGAPVAAELLGIPPESVAIVAALLAAEGTSVYGADLARFPGPDQRAVLEDQTGIGDHLNYGVRTMTADATHLYVGTSNPANLATNESQPLGGWQLIQLVPRSKKK